MAGRKRDLAVAMADSPFNCVIKSMENAAVVNAKSEAYHFCMTQ